MRLLSAKRSIRRKVALAFMVTGTVTALVGFGSVWASRRSGEIAAKAYSETVTATSFARAVASDFGGMRIEAEYALRTMPGAQDKTTKLVDAFHASFLRDLGTAAASSGDPDVAETASTLRASEAAWQVLLRQVLAGGKVSDAMEAKAREVEKGIDWLSYLVAKKGDINRDDARATVASGMTLAITSAFAAFLICAVTSWLIGRGLTRPLEKNVSFAENVAGGVYDAEAPLPSNDEFGDLTRSVVTMRDKLVEALRSQEVLGKLSQERVRLALEEAAEGILIVAGDGTVQLANGPLMRLLGVAADGFAAGANVQVLEAAVRAAGGDGASLLSDASDDGEADFERQSSDGRWVRISRRRTDEGDLVAVLADVSEERRQRNALALAKEDLDRALDNMSQGLAVFGADGLLRLSNARFHELTGTGDANRADGETHASLAAAAARSRGVDERGAKRFAALEAALCRRRRATTRIVSGDGFAMSVAHAQMPDGGFLVTIEDVSRQKAAEKRIQFLAEHDGLTGLPNRTLMQAKVDEALVRARRGRGFAYHALDLDHFKAVNDAMGHAAGDNLLMQVTERLRSCLRETDVVARLGGDEFALLQSDVDDEKDAEPVAQLVVASLSAPYVVMGGDVTIGVSVGIAIAPQNGKTQGEIAIAADQALYKSKENGRGTHTFFSEEMNERSRSRRELETDLKSALSLGQLELHYQPLLDAASMRIGGFEALMRWRHPRRGWVSPVEFIPIAEETGLIRDLGAWAVEEACKEASGWTDDAYVAVNVSAVQLRDPQLQSVVLGALAKTGLLASRLELEITESSLVKDPVKTTTVMRDLRASGVKFALDDFGTGWSSLSTLHAFPFTRIKVDRSFVKNLGAKRGAEQIVRAVVLLGQALSMQITAEGVETRAQLAFLEEVGADAIQGWLVGRAVPAHEVVGLLDLHNKIPSAAA